MPSSHSHASITFIARIVMENIIAGLRQSQPGRRKDQVK
jgi:hypothetical protein